MRTSSPDAENASVATECDGGDSQTASCPRPEQAPGGLVDPADEPTGTVAEPQVREIVRLDASGDAEIIRQYLFPSRVYSVVKKWGSNSKLIYRALELRNHWQEIRDFQVEFKDAVSAIVVSWKVLGLARLGDRELWEAPLAEERELSRIAQHENEGVFTGKIVLKLGPVRDCVSLTRIVRGPQGSGNVQLLANPTRIGMRMPTSANGPARRDSNPPRFDVQAKTNLMACASQVYGQPKFKRFWAARSLLKNHSGQTLRDYSVRFRLGEFAPNWTEFVCPLVLPGQTVVDAYYPLLDNDKLVKHTTECKVSLEVEYQYRQADGQVFRKTQTRSLRMLSRNQVLNTSLPPEECLDFHDEREDKCDVLATLATSEDPVMKEMEGRIARAYSGLACGSSAVDAYKLMEGIFYFMSANVGYTHPSSNRFEDRAAQTVMFGRDVLSNRAGTCMDLALLFSTVCQAGNIEGAGLAVVPGHCFPVIRLPQPLTISYLKNDRGEPRSFRVLGVEATLIGRASFEKAVAVGLQELNQYAEDGTLLVIDIKADHERGVRPLSLPSKTLRECKISEDDTLWMRLVPRFGSVATSQSTPPARRGPGGSGGFLPQPNRETAQAPATPIGRWNANGRFPEGTAYDYILTLDKDGSYKLRQKLWPRQPRGELGQPVENNLSGTYKVGQAAIVFTSDAKEEQVCEYALWGARLQISMPHPQYGRVHFNFLKLPD
jgi:hypothetical protein